MMPESTDKRPDGGPDQPKAPNPAQCEVPADNKLTQSVTPAEAWARTIRSDCPRCRYDLTGLAIGAYCPECGLVIGTISESALPSSGYATASLVFGILAFPACIALGFGTYVCGLLAIGFWWAAKREVRRGERAAHTLGQANAGAILGLLAMIIIAVLYNVFVRP